MMRVYWSWNAQSLITLKRLSDTGVEPKQAANWMLSVRYLASLTKKV